MISFPTECNPGEAVRIVNAAGENEESVSSRGRATPRVRALMLTCGAQIFHPLSFELFSRAPAVLELRFGPPPRARCKVGVAFGGGEDGQRESCCQPASLRVCFVFFPGIGI